MLKKPELTLHPNLSEYDLSFAADVRDDPDGLLKDYEDRMSGVYACGGRVDSNNNMVRKIIGIAVSIMTSIE